LAAGPAAGLSGSPAGLGERPAGLGEPPAQGLVNIEISDH
jgi:hypothetical protein